MVEVPGIDHVCGPRVAGTRITVYDVYYYLEKGWGPDKVAELFKLSGDQVRAAVRFIDANRDDVIAVHQEIEERNARGNSPGNEAKLQESHARLLARLEERQRARRTEVNGEGLACRH